MAATYTWTIERMDCQPQTALGPDFVVTAYWRCTAAEASGGAEYSASNYGTVSFTVQQGGSFTPYEDLTEDQVLSWCWANGVNKSNTEGALQSAIDWQVNPPIVTPPLPWLA